MARPRRSTSAAPAAEEKPASSGANGRSKRPRVSDVDENGASTSASSKKVNKAASASKDDDSTPVKVDKTSVVKKRRLSALPKSPKKTVNPVPKPFGVLESASGAEWPLAAQVDPRKTEVPLSVFAVGNGDMGQLGMGTDATDELRRPKLHPWFERNSQLPTKEEKTDGQDDTAENGDATEGKKDVTNTQTEPALGKLGVEDVACGGMHSLVVDSNGKIWTWGINDNGALGRITQNTGVDSDELEYLPMQITELPEEFRAVRVSASDSASLAVSDNGQVLVWGSFRASDGLLGFDAKTKIQTLPISLPGMAKLQTAQVACGENHVLMLTTGGLVYSFGNGETGQLGRHSSARRRLNGLIPERIGQLSDIVHIAAGDNHSFAIKKDGTVYGWGLNLHKQLGVVDAEESSGSAITPIEIEALDPSNHNGSKVVQIGAGTFHSVFLFDNGSVYVCGGNDEHELGLSDDNIAIQQKGDDKNYISPPVKLDFPNSELENGKETEIIKLSIGTRHSFALSKTGELYAWGLAGAEQLGCNASGEETVDTPKKVIGKAINEYRVLGMATGGQHSMIIAAKPPSTTNGSA